MLTGYAQFQQFVLRAPLRPLRIAFELLQQDELEWHESIQDAVLREALYLASPEFVRNANAYQKLSSEKKFQLEKALLKYLVRATTRCTPFGLFSGCSIGEIAHNTQVGKLKQTIRYTSLDMGVLAEITEKVLQSDTIKLATKFSPNSSLYQIGPNYRYVVHYVENNKKRYKLDNIKHTYYLEKVLKFSIGGKRVVDICKYVVELSKDMGDDFSTNDATAFVDELIEQQLLIPEIAPVTTDGDYFKKISNHITAIDPKHSFNERLARLQSSLSVLDTQGTGTTTDYEQIVKEIHQLGVSGIHPCYFQTDHFQDFECNTLDEKIPKKILKGIEVLSKLMSFEKHDYLEDFKNAFMHRYGSKEVPLSLLFDEEVGLVFQASKRFNQFDLIADFQLKGSGDTDRLQTDTKVLAFLLFKYEQVQVNGLQVLEVSDSESSKLPDTRQKPLSNTFSALVELYKDGTKGMIFLTGAGGSTAINLIARFSQQSSEIRTIVSDVVEKEGAYEPEKIVAEIVHLPDNRTGNILKSCVHRGYEIVYLGNSELPVERQIPISDLYVSIQHDRIRLRSGTLNKEVVPILSNAHNYETDNALPVYRFLCELQFQGKRKAVNFVWPEPFLNFSFLPRVQYKDIIFSKGQWKVLFKEVGHLKSLQEWRQKRKIPQYVQIREHDQFLLLDLGNDYCIELLKSHCKRYQESWIIEFLFTPDNGLQIDGEGYANEFVISYYKKNHEAA